MRLTKKAPAKINITLRVISKREDGFHEILSLFQPLDLADIISITVEEGSGISISCDDPEIPLDERNLAYKAAHIFLDSAGIDRKVHIGIEKHIPVAAGLGGGSSDGATVLMALNEALDNPLSDAELYDIAGKLGSDVPFFLLRGSAVASGRGEKLLPLSLPKYSYILINPGFAISAGWAYEKLALTETPIDIKLTDSSASAESLRRRAETLGESPSRVVDMLENDLEPAALTHYPELTELLTALRESGADGALMSGSGPTVFGLFLSEANAASAVQLLKKSLSGRAYRIIPAKGL